MDPCIFRFKHGQFHNQRTGTVWNRVDWSSGDVGQYVQRRRSRSIAGQVVNRFHSWHSKWSKWISFRLVIRQLPDIVFIHVYPCLSLHVPGAANAALRLLYEFLSNKAEKGQSSTTEVKVTLEHMYNGLLGCEALSDNPSRLTISWISP